MVISTFRHLPWATSAALLPSLPYLSSSSPSDEPSPAAEAAFRFAHLQMTAHSHNPRGHALGLIGFGRIGQLIAQKLGHDQSFGMRVHYHDVVRQPSARERALGATYHATLEGLMAVSDAVVLCTPASADGRPLVTRETLGWLRRPAARFVNIARGSLVDEDALADALAAGTVGAAALDVHADEPRVSRRLLRFAGAELADAGLEGDRMSGAAAVNPGRVMLTCHNAGGTVETHIGFEELAMRNILAVLGGKDAITPVNLHFLPKRESRL